MAYAHEDAVDVINVHFLISLTRMDTPRQVLQGDWNLLVHTTYLLTQKTQPQANWSGSNVRKQAIIQLEVYQSRTGLANCMQFGKVEQTARKLARIELLASN